MYASLVNEPPKIPAGFAPAQKAPDLPNRFVVDADDLEEFTIVGAEPKPPKRAKPKVMK